MVLYHMDSVKLVRFDEVRVGDRVGRNPITDIFPLANGNIAIAIGSLGTLDGPPQAVIKVARENQ